MILFLIRKEYILIFVDLFLFQLQKASIQTTVKWPFVVQWKQLFFDKFGA
jgi:hypothetical protein